MTNSNSDDQVKNTEQDNYVAEQTDAPSADDSSNQEQGEEDEPDEFNKKLAEPKAQPTPVTVLSVKISASLYKSLQQKAEEEGIDVNQLAVEFLAEGVTKRAWELPDRKPHGNRSQPPQFNRNPNNKGYRERDNSRRGNLRSDQYFNIMDDKAAFLEYVRNQQRKRR